jgi:hypothetical protein
VEIRPLLSFLKGAYLKRKLGPPIVVVSGLPRSGTSMMMKMLSAAGLPIVTDEVRGADDDNPRGYFEFERVKQLDKGGDKSWLAEHRGKVLKIISFLLTDLPDDCFYRVVFMRRDLDEVLASQNKMLVRRGEAANGADDEKMKALYANHLRKMELTVGSRPNFEFLDVDYRQVIEDPRGQATRVGKFLSLAGRAQAMAGAVDGRLYRNRTR